MATPSDSIELLLENAEAYAKTTLELAKLRALESGSKILVSLISKSCIVIMAILIYLILNIGAAYFLAEYFGKVYYGFLAVAVFDLLVLLVLQLRLHKWISKPISRLLISKALN